MTSFNAIPVDKTIQFTPHRTTKLLSPKVFLHDAKLFNHSTQTVINTLPSVIWIAPGYRSCCQIVQGRVLLVELGYYRQH